MLNDPRFTQRSIIRLQIIRKQLFELLLCLNDFRLEVNSEDWAELVVLPDLADGGVGLVLWVSVVQGPVEGDGFASLAGADLSEHNVRNSKLLKLILTVRLIILLINDKTGPKHTNIGIYLTQHLLIISILVIHRHPQAIHTLFINHMNRRIRHKCTPPIRLQLVWKVRAAGH